MTEAAFWVADAAGNWRTPQRPAIVAAPFVLGTTKPTIAGSGARVAPTRVELGTNGVFVPTNGVPYDRVEFRCIVRCNAKQDVTFRDCLFSGPTSTTVDSALVECQASSTARILVEFCTFRPQVPSQFWHGIRGRGYTVRRSYFQHCVDGVSVNQSGVSDVVIEGNYVHDLGYFSPCVYQGDNRTHNDSAQLLGGSGTRIVGNVFLNNAAVGVGQANDQTAPAPNTFFPSTTGQCLAVTPNATAGQVSNIQVNYNWLDFGAAGMTIAKGSPAGTYVGEFIGNRFGRNIVSVTQHSTVPRAIVIDPAHTYTASGNVYEDDGTPVTIHVTTAY